MNVPLPHRWSSTVCGNPPKWAYTLAVPGRSVALVERQGSIGGMRSLLLLAPDQNLVVAIVANTEKAPLFEL